MFLLLKVPLDQSVGNVDGGGLWRDRRRILCKYLFVDRIRGEIVGRSDRRELPLFVRRGDLAVEFIRSVSLLFSMFEPVPTNAEILRIEISLARRLPTSHRLRTEVRRRSVERANELRFRWRYFLSTGCGKQLELLDLSGCYRLSSSLLESLLVECPKLRSEAIFCCDNLDLSSTSTLAEVNCCRNVDANNGYFCCRKLFSSWTAKWRKRFCLFSSKTKTKRRRRRKGSKSFFICLDSSC